MPLKPGKSQAAISSNISEMEHKYKQTGTIGNTRPSSPKKAHEIAVAAAMSQAWDSGRKPKRSNRKPSR